MSQPIRRCTRALAATLVACGAFVLAAPAASAEPKVPFSQDVYASTHLAKSGMDITVPRGQFDGAIDLATGEETGTLALPPATVTINVLAFLPAADASFVMEPAGPITGHVDLATYNVDTTASFNVRLAKLTPHGTNINLVGDGCTTVSPVSVRMQGVVNPAAGGTFASTYTIPAFKDCQLLTQAITAFVSGPCNTFGASFAPHGSPAPAAPAAPTPTPRAAPLVSANVQGAVTVGGTPAGTTTLPLDQQLTIPAPALPLPPLLSATPTPEPTPTTSAPPVSPPATGLSGLLGALLGGG